MMLLDHTKNATAEFLIRFIQSAVEIAETANLGKLKWWGGEVGLCSSPSPLSVSWVWILAILDHAPTFHMEAM